MAFSALDADEQFGQTELVYSMYLLRHCPRKRILNNPRNLDDYNSTDYSHEGIRADRGLTYYFIGNRNRQRY